MSSEINGDDNFTTKRFVSAEQTLTSAGAVIIPHGLGVTPALFQFRLICKTAEVGYSIDDELIISNGFESSTGSANYGFSCVPDTTNINIRYGSQVQVFIVNHKTTGVGTGLNNVNWKLIVRAWP
jgi:hypothetical protein